MSDTKLFPYVFKATDLAEHATDKEYVALVHLAGRIARAREVEGKQPHRNYWIVNHNEPYAPQVQALIEAAEKQELKPGQANARSIREALADYAHEAWSGWMRYLFELSIDTGDGCEEIQREQVERWKRQLSTPYAELSEQEKDSDRKEADKMLAIMGVQS